MKDIKKLKKVAFEEGIQCNQCKYSKPTQDHEDGYYCENTFGMKNINWGANFCRHFEPKENK